MLSLGLRCNGVKGTWKVRDMPTSSTSTFPVQCAASLGVIMLTLEEMPAHFGESSNPDHFQSIKYVCLNSNQKIPRLLSI